MDNMISYESAPKVNLDLESRIQEACPQLCVTRPWNCAVTTSGMRTPAVGVPQRHGDFPHPYKASLTPVRPPHPLQHPCKMSFNPSTTSIRHHSPSQGPSPLQHPPHPYYTRLYTPYSFPCVLLSSSLPPYKHPQDPPSPTPPPCLPERRHKWKEKKNDNDNTKETKEEEEKEERRKRKKKTSLLHPTSRNTNSPPSASLSLHPPNHTFYSSPPSRLVPRKPPVPKRIEFRPHVLVTFRIAQHVPPAT
ncbi:hypothetical protein O3P69_005012 [Scylla paramamosain]|uniref:Uncharacterized protein n=1 Tax=Scylla paramamosain TaxID=85552 RepID=A0AAW0UBN2_SCYPA